MISNFFVLSPRGDTILAKQYRINDRQIDSKEIGAHERSHTEAFFRKIKFWDDGASSEEIGDDNGANVQSVENGSDSNKDNNGHRQHDKSKLKYDAPPVFPMPDGYTYFHIKRNGLIFGASTVRNVSPNTVLEVSVIRSETNKERFKKT